MKTLGKKQLPILLGLIGCGLVSCVSSFLLVKIAKVAPAVMFGPMMLWGICLTGCGVLAIFSMIVTLAYYYKKFFTDEGYLTFMFPASAEEQFLAKALSGSIFYLAAELAMLLSFFFSIFYPASSAFSAFGIDFNLTVSSGMAAITPFSLVYGILSFLLSPIQSIVLIYTAITLGSLFFKKHKIGGSVLFYIICSSVVNIATSIVDTLTYVAFPSNQTVNELLTMLVGIVMTAATIIVGYYLSVYMLKKKLNLE